MDNLVRLDLSVATQDEKKTKRTVIPKGADTIAMAAEIKQKQTAVKPLVSTGEIDRMVSYFLERGRFRDACLFVFGCNTSMRIGDILDFRWRDLVNDTGTTFVTGAKIERKTGKYKGLYFNEAVHEAVMLYKANLKRPYNPDEYMFISEGPRTGRVPPDWRNDNPGMRVYSVDVQPMHTRSAARIIRNAAKELGLYTDGRHVSSHSMRKTGMSAAVGFVDGYEPDKRLHDLYAGIQMARMIGNHSKSSTTTGHYVDLEEYLINESYKDMNLGLAAILKYKEDIGWSY